MEATGDVLQFQWQKNATDIHDHGSRYHGTDSDTLHILMVERGDKGCYRCCVKNYEGEEFSNDAVLTVSKFVLTSYTCQPLEFRSVIHNHFTSAADGGGGATGAVCPGPPV